MNIPTYVQRCATGFHAVIAALYHLPPSIGKCSADALSDELGRFRIWRCNIRAHRIGRRSLEFQVRDDIEIREHFIELLLGLEEVLRDVEACIQQQVSEVLVQEDSQSELEYTQNLISKYISQLFRLSILVQNPPRSDFIRAQQLDEAFATLPTEFNRLRALFPYADRGLVQRLGRANIMRRNYLTYRSRRRTEAEEESSRENVDFDYGDSDTNVTASNNNEHFPKPLPSHIAFSETSFATSLLGGTHEGMPKRPKIADQSAEFECPYCFSIITATTPRAWVKHIFTDLMPYMCHFDYCKTPDVLYDSRHHWFWHLETCHETELRHDTETHSGLTCPLCLDICQYKAWPAHVARHYQHPWWPYSKSPSSDDSDDSSPGDDEMYDISSEEIRAKQSISIRLANNRDRIFVQHDDVRLRIIQEGTDWDALGNFVKRTRDFVRNWYQKEIRKWGYGYQLHLAAEQANKEYGREREQFREGRLAFPCLVPDCLADYNTLRELEDHMKTHCQGNWKHWDLYYLDLRSGRAYQSFKYSEVFLEDNFQGTLPPRYPPPLPPGQMPPEPAPEEEKPEPQNLFVPDCLPVDEMLENQGLCRSDILPTMLFRFEHYYVVMANDYCRGLPEDPEARNRNFKYLVDLTLPRVAKKAMDVEQWEFADFEEVRTKLIKDVQSLRRRLNAYESENMDGTLRPLLLSDVQADTEKAEKDTVERQADEGNDEQKVLAIYVSAGSEGNTEAHATERIFRDDASCRLDKTLVGRYGVVGRNDPQIRDDDIFIDLPRYISWYQLNNSLDSTVGTIIWGTYAKHMGFDRRAIECVQQINIDPQTWIAALYYDVKPPEHAVHLDTSDRDRRQMELEQSTPATSASEVQD